MREGAKGGRLVCVSGEEAAEEVGEWSRGRRCCEDSLTCWLLLSGLLLAGWVVVVVGDEQLWWVWRKLDGFFSAHA